VKIGARSRLATVAIAVGDALRRHGIQAVLTGGACASLHSRGSYVSRDMDFIVTAAATQVALDRAMGSLGYRRRGDRYVHAEVPFYVEFPRGPLAIGGDHEIKPVMSSSAAGRALTLSATDSCRDRLAAFYHWNDRQSLDVAVQVACRSRVALASIQRWSAREGFADRFNEFTAELARRRRRMSRYRRR
jgi:hypothetical protein